MRDVFYELQGAIKNFNSQRIRMNELHIIFIESLLLHLERNYHIENKEILTISLLQIIREATQPSKPYVVNMPEDEQLARVLQLSQHNLNQNTTGAAAAAAPAAATQVNYPILSQNNLRGLTEEERFQLAIAMSQHNALPEAAPARARASTRIAANQLTDDEQLQQ